MLTDLCDVILDIKRTQAAAGHTTTAITMEHCVKGRSEYRKTAVLIALEIDAKADKMAEIEARSCNMQDLAPVL